MQTVSKILFYQQGPEVFFFFDYDLRNMEYLRVPLGTKRKSQIYCSRIFKVKYYMFSQTNTKELLKELFFSLSVLVLSKVLASSV